MRYNKIKLIRYDKIKLIKYTWNLKYSKTDKYNTIQHITKLTNNNN